MNNGYQNLKQLENATVNAIEGLDERIVDLRQSLTVEQETRRSSIDGERSARLKLADAQRAYVDEEDRKLRMHFSTFIGRGFWSRFNWLLTGR